MLNKNNDDQTLVAHLEALRRVLIRCLVALGLGLIPMYLLSPYALDWFCGQIALQGLATLHFFSPLEIFLLQLKIALLLDCVICAPFVAYSLWSFVVPALYENERKFVRSIAALTSVLFMAGVLFCLFLCFPLIVQFGMSFSSAHLVPVLGASNVISLALWLSLAFGCLFQFPLVTFALIRSGIVNYESVCHARPYVLVGILILAAFLTPPDVLSQVMLAIPTYLLFEMGLLCARRYKEKPNTEDE